MASLSQRLHSFSMPHLRWGTTTRATHSRTARLPRKPPSVSTTTSETKPAFSVPVLEKKSAQQNSGATDGAAATAMVATSVSAEAGEPAATGGAAPTSGDKLNRQAEKTRQGLLAIPGSKPAEKKRQKKKPFSISLSKEEVEQDFMALVHLKPKRRIKKRNRDVQKTLDSLFPGLYLGLVTENSCRTRTSR